MFDSDSFESESESMFSIIDDINNYYIDSSNNLDDSDKIMIES